MKLYSMARETWKNFENKEGGRSYKILLRGGKCKKRPMGVEKIRKLNVKMYFLTRWVSSFPEQTTS
jgi:hypothetical protein